MQQKYFVRSGIYFSSQLVALTPVLYLFVLSIFINLQSCRGKKAMAEESNTFYTCSMHPQIMEPHPGKCPICRMDLITVKKSSGLQPGEIMLSDQQIQLGNIRVDTPGNRTMGNETVLNATLNFNQEKLAAISSKINGRVEKLYYKNVGDFIQKGTPLFDVYSEALNNAKQEYLLALERREALDNAVIDFSQVIESAKTKLLLWGMTEAQVSQLSITKKFTSTTTFYSPASGYVIAIDVQEGDYTSEGGALFQLADLSTLWAEAQVYISQFAELNENSNVIVQVPGLPGKELTGKIEFVNPEISADKKLGLLRVTIRNEGIQLKPGMSAYISFKNSPTGLLSVPADAVLRNADGASVWVTSGRNIFTNRRVTTGIETGDRVEIVSGLKAGEAVVISGAYLLNSEYIFKEGALPGAGMKNVEYNK